MQSSSLEMLAFLSTLKQGIWFLCIPAWSFGTLERSAAALSHPYISALDVTQVLTAAFFLVCWLLLKPVPALNAPSVDR